MVAHTLQARSQPDLTLVGFEGPNDQPPPSQVCVRKKAPPFVSVAHTEAAK
jgi:hypothetical protein